MNGEVLLQVEKKGAARFEYNTCSMYDDPEPHIREMASYGWRLHSLIITGTVERESSIYNGSPIFMVVMEREVI